MKLFRRKSSTTNVPPEVAEYYQAERRGRRGMTWLMTFFALLVTVVIVLGLFLAGRWLYRMVQGDDTLSSTTSQSDQSQGQAEDGQSGNDQGGDEQSRDTAQSDEPTTDEEVLPREPDRTNDEPTNEPTPDDDVAVGPEPASPREPDSVAPGGSGDELSNTGPGETAIVLFVVSAIAVYGVRVLKLQRR